MPESPAISEDYRLAILDNAPRVLSLMDREPLSPTAGCCDRTYWAWKFVDFPGARFQEALCFLSFLYATKLQGNPYFHNARLLEWIGYGLKFWASIQYRDGSFDEAYPFERSLAATAFTSFYVSEVLSFLGEDLPQSVRTTTHQALELAGCWLNEHDETHGFLSNHLAAAAAALYHIYNLTGNDLYKHRSQYFLERILDHQSPEGWYEEYGGADPGYQTHGSFYLLRLWQLSGDNELYASLEASMKFLAQFIHPDGSLGGEYASRNTQTYYPAAFEMFAPYCPAAAWIAERMRPSISFGFAAGLKNIDIYNYFPILNNLVFAFLETVSPARGLPRPEGPDCKPNLVWFAQAGIALIRRERYIAYVGVAKGGVIKIFDSRTGKLVYNDCGYIGRLHNARLISSQYSDYDRLCKVTSNQIEVTGRFVVVSRPTMKPGKFLAFRFFNLTIGRFAFISQWLKNFLVNVLIYRKKRVNLNFERQVSFEDESVKVRDAISGVDGGKVQQLLWGEKFTTVHMGSSKYFILNELNPSHAIQVDHLLDLDPKMISAGLKLERIITFS